MPRSASSVVSRRTLPRRAIRLLATAAAIVAPQVMASHKAMADNWLLSVDGYDSGYGGVAFDMNWDSTHDDGSDYELYAQENSSTGSWTNFGWTYGYAHNASGVISSFTDLNTVYFLYVANNSASSNARSCYVS